jgi:hypothetical protein
MNSCPPYRPFRGAEPPHFVDRPDDDLGSTGICAASIAAYRRGPIDPRFHRLVVSGPATGKTALLRAISRQAATTLDWAVTFHRCRPKERALGSATCEILASLHRQWPGQVSALAADVLGPRMAPRGRGRDEDHPAGRALAPAPPFLAPGAEATWTELQRLLQLAGRFAQQQGRGLLLVFDDADLLTGGEVEGVGHLARTLSNSGLPVALLLSGGQPLGARFARVGNFSGAVWPTPIEFLDDNEAREALVVPALDRGVEFEDEALKQLCLAAGGSPLDVQRLGFAAWSTAPEGRVICVDDVEDALAISDHELAAARAS